MGTALAFYTAKNPTEKPIDGISTYKVVPFEAGAYFNKIQCFCFEEQRLNPGEEVEVQASLAANTFAVTGHGENKQITDLLPGILNQLGAESLTHLKKLASNVPTADGMDDPG